MNVLIRSLKRFTDVPINAVKYDFLELNIHSNPYMNVSYFNCPNCNCELDVITMNQKICCHECGHWIAWHKDDIWTVYVWKDNVYQRVHWFQKLLNFFSGE